MNESTPVPKSSFVGDLLSTENLKHMAGRGKSVPDKKKPGVVRSALKFGLTSPLDYPLRNQGYNNTARLLNYGSKAIVGASLAGSLAAGGKQLYDIIGDTLENTGRSLGESDEVAREMRNTGRSPAMLWRLFKANALPASLGGDPTPVGQAVRDVAKDEYPRWIRGGIYDNVNRSPQWRKSVDVARSTTPAGAALTGLMYAVGKPVMPSIEYSVNKALEGPLNTEIDLNKSHNYNILLDSINDARRNIATTSGKEYVPSWLTALELKGNPKETMDKVHGLVNSAIMPLGGVYTALRDADAHRKGDILPSVGLSDEEVSINRGEDDPPIDLGKHSNKLVSGLEYVLPRLVGARNSIANVRSARPELIEQQRAHDSKHWERLLDERRGWPTPTKEDNEKYYKETVDLIEARHKARTDYSRSARESTFGDKSNLIHKLNHSAAPASRAAGLLLPLLLSKPTEKSSALLPSVKLQPHQERLFNELSTSQEPSRKLLLWQLGSGKSLGGIAGAESINNPYLVITPASLRPTWHKERQKFTDEQTPADVLSYTEIAKGKTPSVTNPSTLVVDEAARLNNPSSKQTEQTKELANKTRNLLLLTGTPITNKPSDLAPLMSMLTKKEITPEEFTDRYVREKHVNPNLLQRLRGITSGTELDIHNEDELRNLLKGHVDYYAPSKPTVPTSFEDHEVEMSTPQSQIYKAMFDKLPWVIRWKLKMDYPLSRDEYLRMQSFMTGPRQVGLSTLPFQKSHNPGRAFADSTKLQKAMSLLQERLKDDRSKALIFSNFIDAGLTPYAHALGRAGIPHAVFHGGLNDRQRKQLVDDYNANKLRVALLGPSGAEGLSFKGTQLVQLLDPYWHNVRTRQQQGRGIRFDSHTDLPEELRNVTVQRFIAKLPVGLKDRIMARLGFNTKPNQIAADDILKNMAARKDRLNDSFMNLLKDIGSEKRSDEWTAQDATGGSSWTDTSPIAQAKARAMNFFKPKPAAPINTGGTPVPKPVAPPHPVMQFLQDYKTPLAVGAGIAGIGALGYGLNKLFNKPKKKPVTTTTPMLDKTASSTPMAGSVSLDIRDNKEAEKDSSIVDALPYAAGGTAGLLATLALYKKLGILHTDKSVYQPMPDTIPDQGDPAKKRWKQITEPTIKFGEVSTAVGMLGQLKTIKELSDQRKYDEKHIKLRNMMEQFPYQWDIKDDPEVPNKFVSVTHWPTGFRLHTLRAMVPANVYADIRSRNKPALTEPIMAE